MGEGQTTLPQFWMPMIGAAITVAIGMAMMNLVVLIQVQIGTGFTSTGFLISLLLTSMLGFGFPGLLIIICLLGFVLHPILSAKVNFEKIPMILGIVLLALSALLITITVLASVKPYIDYFDMIGDFPTKTGLLGYYVAASILALAAAGVNSLGILGGIGLIKYQPI